MVKLTSIKAIILGIIQGIAEFLPISSSAHLKLFKIIFNIEIFECSHFLDLAAHSGTVLASIIFLKSQIRNLKKSEIYLIFLAIVPLAFVYFFTKPVRVYLSQDSFMPYFLLLTGALLYIASKVTIKKNTLGNSNINISNTNISNSNSPTLIKTNELTLKKIKDVLLIGLMQGFALIPGISRSASTIAMGYFRGWKIEKAIKFSFLLAIPTIIGGSFLESLKLFLKKDTFIENTPITSYIIVFFTSFIVGLFAIKYIFSIKSNKRLKPFAIYLFALAIVAFFYLR